MSINGTKKGKTPSDVSSTVAPDIRDAINKFPPTGGVQKPISQVRAMNTPKNTGSIPY